MAILGIPIQWMIKAMFLLKLEGTRKKRLGQKSYPLNYFWIVEQDAVVEWALLR